MAVFNYISLKYIISKIYRDLRLEDPNYELDIVEWCGEALSFIGAGSQFAKYVVEQPIVSFKAPLPSGLATLEQVMYKDNINDKPTVLYRNDTTFPNELYKLDNDNQDITYTINGNYILFSKEDGICAISYKGIATDDDGYPLVPDNQYYKEALFWYCFKHILMLGYKSPSGIDYPFAEARWQFYCTGARNKANYPSISEYEQFKNSWTGLLSNMNSYKERFDNSFLKKPIIEEVQAGGIMTTPTKIPQSVIVDGGNANTEA
jgi:hypothetical protein